ncbi:MULTISPECIES: general secretion pathway protein GspN [Rhodanobacter]|uniref:General secretion pathway protein GspN n=1 Tax=Rhodanobacter hydrolyticus TaxID=2250595 RepID=A0ABW8J9B4_9GAMM|nr:general secretion pathway protein GspN [Rhodanobacter sp. 7MK24]MBD8881842.1 general secretion pathway protein GspN [Rhodanobacter sp. 7MK24]
MNAASQRRLTAVLATLVLLLGVLWLTLLFGFGRGVRWDAPRAAPPPSAAGPHTGLPAPVPLAVFAPVWQQSLFSPDRKPEVHAASGGSSLGDLQLTGIILTPQLRMALLHDNNGNRELRLREGQSLPDGSVSVIEVKQRSVILDSPQGRTELKLPPGATIDVAKPVAGAPPPPPPSPPPGVEMMTPVPHLPGQMPPQANPQQLERLRQLRAAVLQHRAANQAANPEGAH